MIGFDISNLLPTRMLGNALSGPASSLVSSQVVAEMVEGLGCVLRNVLVIQSGILLVTLVLGLFSPRLGQVLYWMTYGGIAVYSIAGLKRNGRLLAYMLDKRSFTKGLSQEMQVRVMERSRLAFAASYLLVDLEVFCNQTAEKVWRAAQKPLVMALGLLVVNWLVVRIYLFSLLQ